MALLGRYWVLGEQKGQLSCRIHWYWIPSLRVEAHVCECLGLAFLCFLIHILTFSVKRRLGIIKASNFATFWAILVRGGPGIIEANLLFWYVHIYLTWYPFYEVKGDYSCILHGHIRHYNWKGPRRLFPWEVTWLLAMLQLHACPTDHNMTNERTYPLELRTLCLTLSAASLL